MDNFLSVVTAEGVFRVTFPWDAERAPLCKAQRSAAHYVGVHAQLGCLHCQLSRAKFWRAFSVAPEAYAIGALITHCAREGGFSRIAL